MTTQKRWRSALLAGAALLAVAGEPARAGDSTAKPTVVLPPAQTAALATRVERDLAAKGVQVALVGRLGRPRAEMPEGISYTHVAYWVYSKVRRPDGDEGFGYVAHNLYQDAADPDRSALVQDLPADFFAGVQALDTGVIVPDPRLQAKLLDVLAGPRPASLYNPAYSLIANPYRDEYQNCTAYTLNLLMAALYATDDMARIKANTRAHFAAQTVDLGPMQRLLGPVFAKGVVVSDHAGGPVRTATFDTIARFMEGHGLVDEVYRLTPTGREEVRY